MNQEQNFTSYASIMNVQEEVDRKEHAVFRMKVSVSYKAQQGDHSQNCQMLRELEKACSLRPPLSLPHVEIYCSVARTEPRNLDCSIKGTKAPTLV